MSLVFQFGSNTSSHRLNGADRLQGDATSLGLARTVDQYRYAFSAWSDRMEVAVANLLPEPDRVIHGVLWDIPDTRIVRALGGDRMTLDAIEHEGETYRRTRIRVVHESSGRDHQVWTYFVRKPRSGLRTGARYVHHVFTGLREHEAPEEYVDYLKRIVAENNPDLARVVEDW